MTDKPVLEADRFWPRLHFVAPTNWINDPNGLVRLGSGWRLFFQYADDAPEFRRVHWGTASSPDLFHWRFDGIAISAAPRRSVYSGSVLVEPLRAFYTMHHAPPGAPARQTQHQAQSDDGGRTFTSDDAACLLDEGLADFRDPFVWRRPQGDYSMLVAKPVPWNAGVEAGKSVVAVYRSSDTLQWTACGEIGPYDGAQVVWEVPWIAELQAADGSTHALFAVSVVDRSGGGVRCATRYWLGKFDGARFSPHPDQPGLPLDSGPDYYAAIASTPIAASRLLTIAWASSWAYARELSVAPWAGGPLSLPRDVAIVSSGGAWRLQQQPATGLNALSDPPAPSVLYAVGAAPLQLSAAPPAPYIMDIEWDLGLAAGATLEMAGGALRLLIEGGGSAFALERPHDTRLPTAFAGRWQAARHTASTIARLRIIVDSCVLEVFADDGSITFCALMFPLGESIRAWADGSSASLRVTMTPLRCSQIPGTTTRT